ncbi:MAG: AAA family ATPase, partial [Dehalococcoidia bacterium]
MEPGREQELRVKPDQLRRPPAVELPASTEAVKPLTTIAGQTRAQDALEFGLRMRVEGYNIAVPGAPASGRGMIIHHLVDRAAAQMESPPDWLYLHDFADPRRPRAVAVEAGKAEKLQKGLASVVESCRDELPKALDSDNYSTRRDQVLEPFGEARQAVMEELDRKARSRGIGLNATSMGLVPVALTEDGQPLTADAFNALPEEQRDRITAELNRSQEDVQAALRDVRKIDLDARTALEDLDREITDFVVGPALDELSGEFPEPRIQEHLRSVRDDIRANLASYRRFAESQTHQIPPQMLAQALEEREMLLRRYRANVFVSQTGREGGGAPVVDERHHGYRNLFGWIDYENRFGSMVTDFTRIHPGAVHRANGGFLILQIQDLLSDGRAWLKLKRTLHSHEAGFDDPADLGLPFPVAGLQPEGVPVDLKVILVGTGAIFAMLAAVDPEFDELFRVRAEFEPDVPADRDNTLSYVAFVRRTADEHSLRQFDAGALEEILHHSARLAGRQDRLSARYGLIADLCHESNEVAGRDGADLVSA